MGREQPTTYREIEEQFCNHSHAGTRRSKTGALELHVLAARRTRGRRPGATGGDLNLHLHVFFN